MIGLKYIISIKRELLLVMSRINWVNLDCVKKKFQCSLSLIFGVDALTSC